MRLFELTLPKTRADAQEILAYAGYERIGYGGFADVYRNRNAPYVLKLFSAQDKAYLSYLAIVKNHPSPHFPKMIGKLIKVTPQYYAVRLEPLNKLRETSNMYHIVSLARLYVSNHDVEIPTDYHPSSQWFVDHLIEARKYMDENPLMKEACDIIGGLIPPYKLDMDVPNCMLRGSTLVFVDPIFDPNHALNPIE